MPSAISAGPSANQVPAAASAAVAAQAIDEKASAKVAMRDEVCRRRNWLRLACVRKQIWMSVAAAAAARTPSAATSAPRQRIEGQHDDDRREHQRDHADHRFDLGAQRRGAAAIGALATRSGASSPEIDSQARPPASWPAAITTTGISTT